MLIENNKTWIAGKGWHFKHLTTAFEFRWKSEAASFTNNRAYSPNEQLGEDCSWSVCCICCCGCWSVCCCCCVIWESILVGDRNNECVWLCGCCGCWNWKCCCEVNRSICSLSVSMLWNWLLWFGFGIKLRLAASRLLRDCFDGNSQLSNILIDVDGSSNRNNPFVTQLPVKCCCVWFVFDSGCDWFCWLFWDCFATASKIVAIYNIRGQTGFWQIGLTSKLQQFRWSIYTLIQKPHTHECTARWYSRNRAKKVVAQMEFSLADGVLFWLFSFSLSLNSQCNARLLIDLPHRLL